MDIVEINDLDGGIWGWDQMVVILCCACMGLRTFETCLPTISIHEGIWRTNTLFWMFRYLMLLGYQPCLYLGRCQSRILLCISKEFPSCWAVPGSRLGWAGILPLLLWFPWIHACDHTCMSSWDGGARWFWYGLWRSVWLSGWPLD